jgi:hypothetical protein
VELPEIIAAEDVERAECTSSSRWRECSALKSATPSMEGGLARLWLPAGHWKKVWC